MERRFPEMMMADRIGALPDRVLCHILSFLPTKEAVTTSVLSKRWKPLWRTVPSLHFDDFDFRFDKNKENYLRFVQWVYGIILSRDWDQPIQSFYLRCLSSLSDSSNVNIWVNAVLQRRVEHLDISLRGLSIGLPSAVPSCKTLVVLKLSLLSLKAFSSFDLPSLKTLHLNVVTFLDHSHFAELLCATPNLEDLEAKNLSLHNYYNKGKFRRLPKLVRANVSKFYVPLEVIRNVEFLCINWVINDEGQDVNPNYKDLIPDFHNLTHLEVQFESLTYTREWLEVLELLKHCPKLKILFLDKEVVGWSDEGDKEPDWSYPPSIPICISSHLKTCRLNNYEGSKGEFRFATYIMQNALHLQTMTVCSTDDDSQGKKLEMIKKLSFCPRCSASCRLSFE